MKTRFRRVKPRSGNTYEKAKSENQSDEQHNAAASKSKQIRIDHRCVIGLGNNTDGTTLILDQILEI